MKDRNDLIQERDEYRLSAKESEMLHDLMNHPGFRVLVKLYKDRFAYYFEILRDSDDVNARAGIKNLQELFSMIDNTLDIGEDAKTQLSKEIFKNLGNTV